MADYDSTNRGGGWAANAVSGNLNIEGVKRRASMVATNASPTNQDGKPNPQAMLFIYGRGEPTIAVALFSKTSEQYPNNILGGTMKLDDGLEYWVNVYRNTKGGKCPQVDFVIKAKEQRQAAPAPVGAASGAWGAPATEPEPYEPPNDSIPF